MSRRLPTLLAFFLAACAPKSVGQAPAPATLPPPLLWEVSSGKGDPVYLYGTIHMGGADDVHPAAWKKLEAATTFVMEADVEGMDQMAMLGFMMLPEGESLEAMLDKDHWSRLVTLFHGKVPAVALARMKPWIAAVTALTLHLPPSPEPPDLALLHKAKAGQKKVEYLESVELQFRTLGEAMGVADLVELIDNYQESCKVLADLQVAYKAGDAAEIERISFDPKFMKPKHEELMITKRNEAWIPLIEQHLAQGNVFVAVGAAHLVGPHSVPKLLEAKGYRVTRVTSP